MTVTNPPELARMFGDPDTIASLPTEHLPAALTHLAALQCALAGRLASAGLNRSAPREDRLLDIEEAARRLNMSVSSLYRGAARMPFTVKQGRSVRFSSLGIDRYIQRRQGTAG